MKNSIARPVIEFPSDGPAAIAPSSDPRHRSSIDIRYRSGAAHRPRPSTGCSRSHRPRPRPSWRVEPRPSAANCPGPRSYRQWPTVRWEPYPGSSAPGMSIADWWLYRQRYAVIPEYWHFPWRRRERLEAPPWRRHRRRASSAFC